MYGLGGIMNLSRKAQKFTHPVEIILKTHQIGKSKNSSPSPNLLSGFPILG